MDEPLSSLRDGPQRQALFNRITAHLNRELASEGRKERANKRIVAALIGDVEELASIPHEDVTEEEFIRHELFTGCLALFSMADAVRSSEYYFRRYRFAGLPVSKADHLRDCCEMYFDRIVQFRDRMKSTLTSARKINPQFDFQVGNIVRSYDKVFSWEIRQRNRVHHKGRYDDQFIDQLGLLQILEIGNPEVRSILSSRGVHRSAVNLWVKKVRDGAKTLANLLEQLSALILAGLPPDETVTDRATPLT